MKRFSLEKYKKDMGYTNENIPEWAKKVAGWTLEDIENKTYFGIADAWIEEVNMTKEDLKNGDIVTLRNGDRFLDISRESNNPLASVSDLDEDMTYQAGDGNKQHDIIKVERPLEYETVFKRDEETQELTVDEISERLGYKVKVVGEDR